MVNVHPDQPPRERAMDGERLVRGVLHAGRGRSGYLVEFVVDDLKGDVTTVFFYFFFII